MALHPFKYGDLHLKTRITEEQAVQILSAAAQVCTHLGIIYPEDAVVSCSPIFLDIIKLSEALKEADIELLDVERENRNV